MTPLLTVLIRDFQTKLLQVGAVCIAWGSGEPQVGCKSGRTGLDVRRLVSRALFQGALGRARLERLRSRAESDQQAKACETEPDHPFPRGSAVLAEVAAPIIDVVAPTPSGRAESRGYLSSETDNDG